MLSTDVAVHQGLWHHSNSPACMDSRRNREPSRSHGLKARIMIFLLNLLGLRFWTRRTSCTTRIAGRGCSLKWMPVMQDEEHAHTRWCNLGWGILMKKAGEGKATLDRGKSFNGPAKRGRLLSLSSLSFIGSRWPGYWRWRDTNQHRGRNHLVH